MLEIIGIILMWIILIPILCLVIFILATILEICGIDSVDATFYAFCTFIVGILLFLDLAFWKPKRKERARERARLKEKYPNLSFKEAQKQYLRDLPDYDPDPDPWDYYDWM